MAYIKKVLVLVLTACCLSFCASRQQHQMDFPQTISVAYFQKTNGVEDQYENGFDFYIELEKPLIKGIIVEKLHFKNQVAVVEQQSSTIFVAHFYQKPTNQDLILDSDPRKEYGNKAPVIAKSRFDLKATEAVLEYKYQNESFYYTIETIKERPMIANPSGIKPKN
jgi:hypothetical protein